MSCFQERVNQMVALASLPSHSLLGCLGQIGTRGRAQVYKLDRQESSGQQQADAIYYSYQGNIIIDYAHSHDLLHT
jgi:hypothetical protein